MPAAVAKSEMLHRSITLADRPATESLARAVAERLAPGDCVTLRGELGAGKTTFARALIRAIAPHAEDVPSPTFTLVQPYEVKTSQGGGTLYHCDLYRLKDASEWPELGVEEEMGRSITLIEWPEIIASFLPQERLDITLDFGAGDARVATLESAAPRFLQYAND